MLKYKKMKNDQLLLMFVTNITEFRSGEDLKARKLTLMTKNFLYMLEEILERMSSKKEIYKRMSSKKEKE